MRHVTTLAKFPIESELGRISSRIRRTYLLGIQRIGSEPAMNLVANIRSDEGRITDLDVVPNNPWSDYQHRDPAGNRELGKADTAHHPECHQNQSKHQTMCRI